MPEIDSESKRKPSYLSAKRLLPKEQHKEYIETRQAIERMRLQKRLKELKAEKIYTERQVPSTPIQKERAFHKRAIVGVYNAIRNFGRPAQAQAYYRSVGQLPPQSMMTRMNKKTVQGYKSNKRGRPKGTLDQRYASYGGVYGFRRAMALKLREERLRLQRQYQITPQQEAYLNQKRAEQMAAAQNPENGVIPDSQGNIKFGKIFTDIDDYTNLVP